MQQPDTIAVQARERKAKRSEEQARQQQEEAKRCAHSLHALPERCQNAAFPLFAQFSGYQHTQQAHNKAA